MHLELLSPKDSHLPEVLPLPSSVFLQTLFSRHARAEYPTSTAHEPYKTSPPAPMHAPFPHHKAQGTRVIYDLGQKYVLPQKSTSHQLRWINYRNALDASR